MLGTKVKLYTDVMASRVLILVCFSDYWVIQPDEDSGFQDDCSSVAYGEGSDYPVQITGYKTKSWSCFASSKKQDDKPKEEQEKIPEKNGLFERSGRKQNFLQRATKKIIGKTKRIFGNLKAEEEKKAASLKPEATLKENHTTQVNIILPANSSTSINTQDLVDDGKVNFFRADPLRSPFRESRSSSSSRESRDSYPYSQSDSLQSSIRESGSSLSSWESRDPQSDIRKFPRNSFQRCSIRGPRDSFFRESRDAFPRASDRETMLRVLFDFEACDDDDVSVRRGELVKVLNKEDDDWWWVENVYHDRGFVPRNFLWPCGCYGK